jgi:hypothetical protein
MRNNNAKMLVDYRRDPRRSASMDGFVVMAGAVPTPCYVKNISFGGVYIKSNKEAQFQIGDIVELRITDFIGLVNGDILIIKGVIEHSVANGYGIRFYAPELEKYDVLTRMVFERDLS